MTSSSREALIQPQVNKPRRLRELLAKGTVPMPGAFNAITAKIIEKVGFPALYISGAGIANGVTGYPDIGLATMDEMARYGGYIARSVNIPAIADGDTGYGEAMNVFRTVQEYERAGIAGIHIEDQVFPKRCGHLGGKQVIPADQMAAKINAAVQARSNPDFLVIARVDSRAVHGFDDALERAGLYLESGADMIFAEALENADEFERFAGQLRQKHPNALLLANMTEFGKTPYLTLQEFERFGYNIVIYPMTAFRVMMKAVEESMAELFRTGTQSGFLDRMTTRQELYELIHYEAYEALDEGLAKTL
jgi:methylisocitrate lyase